MDDLITARTFSEDVEPPIGERIQIQNPDGWRFTWTGKRWHEGWGAAHPCLHEAWPPDCDGPFVEVREACPVDDNDLDVFIGKGLQLGGGLMATVGLPVLAWSLVELKAGNDTAPNGVFGGCLFVAVGLLLATVGWWVKRRG